MPIGYFLYIAHSVIEPTAMSWLVPSIRTSGDKVL
jgi:hypothetical protein